MDSNGRKRKSTNIILVGNGSSVLDKQNGLLINSFDTVVRFNSFKIKGYEAHVGTKTNIWFTVNSHHIERIQDFKSIICHSWACENECENFKKIKNKRADATMVNKELIKSIPVKLPSTGLIAIFYFLNQYNEIYITGFDWWDRNKHHYGDNEIRGNNHNPKEEYKIIQSLKNKVKFI